MRTALVVAVVVVLIGAGVHWLNERSTVGEGPVPPPVAYPDARWGRVDPHFDLAYRLPEVFRHVEPAGNGNQRVHYAPKHNGFRPQWQLYRRPSKWKNPKDWWRYCEEKLRARFGQGGLVEADATDRVAGRPARRFVVEDYGVREDGTKQRVLTVQWCWLRGTYAYWVRGVADADSFRSGHGALFGQIKSTVSHVDEDA